MTPQEISHLADQQLLEAAKNNKPSPLFDACCIGFLIGILVFSAAANAWGLVSIVQSVLDYVS